MFRLLFCSTVAALLPAWGAVDFTRDVRPILSDACYHCHGPDKATRMAGLRLDQPAEAYATRRNGTPIVPGQPEASLIIQRVEHPKPALRMPPANAHKTLTPAQVSTLKQWIAEGAQYKEHWAFQPPQRPALAPATGWSQHPVDRFVAQKLTTIGLRPASRADRRTLARRASLDLTGLPPEPAEVESFLADQAPGAYERYVDRLLASPHYGEHRARYWLDAARYADTHGLHIDNYREMWHWRDYVIQAFNKNLPWDRFTREQLAGDLLPNRSTEQWVASGFHRNNVTTNEGGVIEDEVAAMYAKDRVDTTATVFLGLTLGCATCHDHKFDPLAQKDFYAMAAFFRNTTQRPLDGNVADTPPVIFLPTAADVDRWSRIDAETISARGRLGGLADAMKPMPFREGKQLKARWSQERLDIPDEKAAYSEAKFSWIDIDRPFTLAARIYYPKPDENWTVLSQVNGKEEEAKNRRGWTLDILSKQPTFRFYTDKGEALVARTGNSGRMQPGNWYHVAIVYDGSRRKKDAFTLYFNATRIPTYGRTFARNARVEGSSHSTEPLRIGSDGGKGKFKGGAIEDLRIYDRTLSAEEVSLLTALPDARAGQAYAIARWNALARSRDFRRQLALVATLEAEKSRMEQRGAVTHVMVEKPDSLAKANILFRGMYDQPREEVIADIPAVLGSLGDKYPRNRLGLADWLLEPGNPLFARVAVNRFWQEIFGVGLVRSADDFGNQGEAPSHPELLDWLAVEFRESGWDVKKLLRLLVTSETYQQQAVATEEKLKSDPANQYLSRGPRFRMDAEMVRDYALAASGLLVRTIGGPSVRPYQPENIWETVAMEQSDTRFYQQEHGDALYRRSMYTFWKRSSPPPAMDIFNAPTREVCTVKRERTNTPLQALLTMNDVQFVEAARVLAGKAIEAHKNDFDRQLDYLTSRLVTRRFTDQEREIARSSYRDFLRHYDSNLEDARRLTAAGEAPPSPKLPKPEWAALTLLTNQLMNLDEVLNK
ncbi:MAG: DUF1553 domain-containing protein [Bryobacter sp.]|nr:DUF1553 domain-containing protein [Bryobacter sp.]